MRKSEEHDRFDKLKEIYFGGLGNGVGKRRRENVQILIDPV